MLSVRIHGCVHIMCVHGPTSTPYVEHDAKQTTMMAWQELWAFPYRKRSRMLACTCMPA